MKKLYTIKTKKIPQGKSIRIIDIRNTKILQPKDWDILDGRTKKGKTLKTIAKVIDLSMYVLSCATLSAIIIYVIFQ